jgi:hypothetical protein
MYTGAWTLQISRRAPPNTKFIALDVNTSQLPPKVFLADNMEVKHCNLLEPSATDLLEAFDITNILLVLLFVNGRSHSARSEQHHKDAQDFSEASSNNASGRSIGIIVIDSEKDEKRGKWQLEKLLALDPTWNWSVFILGRR